MKKIFILLIISLLFIVGYTKNKHIDVNRSVETYVEDKDKPKFNPFFYDAKKYNNLQHLNEQKKRYPNYHWKSPYYDRHYESGHKCNPKCSHFEYKQ